MKYSKYILLSIIFLSGCAKVVRPPGGPEDRTAPGIAVSMPASGSLNVTPDNIITIFFSEKIVRPEKDKVIFISPRPEVEPQLRWKSDQLIIALDKPFKDDKTYIISFGNNIKDRRNNQFDSTAFIAFSTGSKIDSGSVEGYIKRESGTLRTFLVGLYEQDIFKLDSQLVDSIYPTYLAQVNKNGYFNFRYLPDGNYSLIAFDDKNKDERFSPGTESFALPDRPIVVTDSVPTRGLKLPVNFEDSSSLQIERVSFSSDGIFRVLFNQMTSISNYIEHPDDFLFYSNSDTLIPLFFLEEDNLLTPSIHCYTGVPKDSIYTLRIKAKESGLKLQYDSIKVVISEDKNKPRIIGVTADSLSASYLDELEVQFLFSEPLDTMAFSSESYNLIDQDSQLIDIKYEFPELNKLVFYGFQYSEGASYRLQLAENDFKDLAGNSLGDTLRDFSFSIYDPDSLGVLRGGIVNNYDNQMTGPYNLEFTRLKTKKVFNLIVLDSLFSLTLPEGKYSVNSFIDLNQDGHKTAGSFYDKQFAEPQSVKTDTVDVRARFETSGLIITFE